MARNYIERHQEEKFNSAGIQFFRVATENQYGAASSFVLNVLAAGASARVERVTGVIVFLLFFALYERPGPEKIIYRIPCFASPA
jgi:hypothetical protein